MCRAAKRAFYFFVHAPLISPFHPYDNAFSQEHRDGSSLPQGKRVFIKDITYYLVPPEGKAPHIAPSLASKKRGIGTKTGLGETSGSNGDSKKLPFPYDSDGEVGNPTVVPRSMLEKFHWTFLIRDPHSSIPSYYRCTIPPLDDMTGFHDFYPNEAGYDEERRLFDYLRQTGQVGPEIAGTTHGDSDGASATSDSNDSAANSDGDKAELCVIDADDLLDDPEGIIKAYCKSVGLDFTPEMLNWDNDEDQTKAEKAFEKWKGFHEDAIDSKDLKPRAHVSFLGCVPDGTNARQKKAAKSEEQWDSEWEEKYGLQAAKMIRETVDENMADYRYLKQFAIKV